MENINRWFMKEKFKERAKLKHDRIHVISSGNKWRVIKSGAKRATGIHTHREEAYYHARTICDHVVVHNKDAGIAFVYKKED